jgi:hypothetical protein
MMKSATPVKQNHGTAVHQKNKKNISLNQFSKFYQMWYIVTSIKK